MSGSALTAPPPVRWIARTLEEAGHETWAVGGAIRDHLVGLETGEWDLATRARPGDVRRIFRRTVPIGVEHGTVGVLARDGTLYEVTTFRRDVETFGRRAVVEFAEELEEDLARRDFTVNAVAFHPLREEIRDPFGGIDDLRRGVLRTVGEAPTRFAEDYLRVLRGLRFTGRFDLTIEQKTWRALCEATSELGVLSAERIREELTKVLEADPRPSGTLGLYAASGALRELYPELENTVGRERAEAEIGDRWSHALLMADALPPSRPLLRLAALLHGVGEESWGGEVAADRTAAVLIRLRFSNTTTERVTRLVRAGVRPPEIDGAGGAARRRWLSQTGPELLSDLARLWIASCRVEGWRGADAPPPVRETLRALRAELRARPPLSVEDLAVDGRDLIGIGLKPGPRFGEILRDLLERVLDDPDLNEEDTLLALVDEAAAGGPVSGESSRG